jgi:hypothetical protein
MVSQASQLTQDAQSLLAQLRVGGNVADARASIGAFAFSSHAQAFFSNAIALCDDDGLSDFRVYGALYSLRHALELMLKCIVRNEMIDATLSVLMIPELSFDDACTRLSLKKPERKLLLHAVCVLRNLLEDSIVYPRCHNENIDVGFAQRALEYLRQNPSLPRDRFSIVWASTAFGHDLNELWREAAPTITRLSADARRHAQEIGFDPPLTVAELRPIIELIAALDDGGDGFRYPSSLYGEWYVAAPCLSLEALRELIERLDSTCTIFSSVREQCYSMATVQHPTPGYTAGY